MIAAMAALLLAGPAAAVTPFDGRWGVVLTCPTAADGALGYVYRFDAAVSDGMLHGQNSTQGAPGYLVLDGPIRPDGSADLSAHGETGSPDYAVGRVGRGTGYEYRVQARFDGATGTGQRMSVRACTLSFQKYR